jgi:hypothetical protein
MPNFFEGRTIVKAEDLRGPRVYSTDLLPSLYDATRPDESVTITARALKIKVITKGLVTLNSTHLVSPLAVKLLDSHPDLFQGDAIVPAFRDDMSSLADWISTTGDRALGYDESQMRDHVARVESLVKRVMPWTLGSTGDTYKRYVLDGLRDVHSIVRRQLEATGVTAGQIDKMLTDIETLDFSNSLHLREYISGLQEDAQKPLRRFTAACYHKIGTEVVRCETGMDLNPLSAFKVADMTLAGKERAEELSEEVVFIECFMGFALDAIQASLLPTDVIDTLSFELAHQLSGALRAQGFQEKYDEVTTQYVSARKNADAGTALESLNEESVAVVARELADTFQQAVINELPHYRTAIQEEARANIYRSGADVGRDLIGTIPGLGEIVSFADAVTHSTQLAGDIAGAAHVRDQRRAFEQAQLEREEKIQAAIHHLKTSDRKKSRLLDAVAALSDIHVTRIRRA